MRVSLLILLLSAVASLHGSSFYLSPQGNDLNGDGSINAPWFTLEKAWKAAVAGDTIWLRGGTFEYITMQDLTGKDGINGKRIKIWAFPGERPVITKGSTFDMVDQSNLIFIEADYVHLKGLEISNFSQKPGIRASSALFCYTSYSIFENLNYHHNGLGMVIRGKSTENLILNCDFHHNYDPYNNDPYHHSDGLDIAEMPSGTRNTVKGCRFYLNGDDGLDLWNNEGTVIIDSCWSWHNGYREDGITPGGDGAGFKLGQTTIIDNSTYRRIITNSLSVSNRNFGITQNAAKCKMFICNNVFYDNKYMGIYFSASWGDASHVIRNNISYKNATDAAIGIRLPVVDHNSWFPEYIVSDDDFLSVDTSELEHSRNDDGTLPKIDFMHLTPGSDLIDTGIDVGIPYWGNAPDLGAFETITGTYHINKPPVVSIAFSAKGSSFTAPATVEVNIEASDPDGTISKVELYNGSKKIAESTTAPYSFTIKDLPAGSYFLRAIAIDDMNASSVSSTLEVTVVAFNQKGEHFNLYPNPNDGRFTVDFSSLVEAKSFMLTVVDLIGNTVFQEQISSDEPTRQFDLSHLNSGIYILIIAAGQILLTQKLILN
ncbi:MAG TPA: Ig-like domain-containing protein [Bacteroidales bacterium]|jgi:hypothetical protein|nr:Ig-like domain-containing protein [Bacteroidales bacterium]